MRRRPTVISYGLCCDSGNGAGAAFRASFGKSGFLFKPFGDCGLYASRRFEKTHVGEACVAHSEKLPRCAKILFAALDEALEKVSLSSFDPERIGVYAGTSVGGILESENAFEKILKGGKKGAPPAFNFYECSAMAELVARRAGARGECATYSTACSSSSLALESACLAISEGRCDAAIVCGADTLSRITVEGFGSLGLLSKSDCRPFDSERDGINLGEAGGAVILCAREKLPIGARALAEFISFGATCDAYHATSPHPGGEGAKKAIEKCMRKGCLAVSDISYYCAHGTGTPANDSAELSALKGVFGENVPPYSSVKSIFGHTLGASGILNAIIAIDALREGTLPPSAGYVSGSCPGPLERAEKPCHAKAALSVSLGFGGNNSCAAISVNNLEADVNPKESAHEPISEGGIFIYGAGVSRANAGSDMPPGPGEISLVDENSLLPDIPVLKKRKWAKLQKMFISASREAVSQAKVSKFGDSVCVSCSTGLGMVSETSRFLENFMVSDAPLPTAFTNSVHNAPPSAIAGFLKCFAYNCASTAKEISFEAALMEACARIRNGDCAAAIVAGGDEYNSLAAEYAMKKCLPKGSRAFSDSCAAYFIGKEGCCEGRPLAEIMLLKIRRSSKNPKHESAWIEESLSEAGISADSIKAWFTPCRLSGFSEKLLEGVSLNFGGFTYLEDLSGRNYSASAFGADAALSRGIGFYAQYSLSSASMAALTVYRVL